MTGFHVSDYCGRTKVLFSEKQMFSQSQSFIQANLVPIDLAS